MENPRVRKLIDDLASQAALQMATALRPLIRARLEEVCREALGIVTREIEEAILVSPSSPAPAPLDPKLVAVMLPPITELTQPSEAPEGSPPPAPSALKTELGLALAGITIPPPKPVTPPAPVEPPAAAEPPTLAEHLGVARVGKVWRCAACGKKFPSRRGATTHSRKCAGRAHA